MSNIIDSIRLSGTTYQIQGSGGGGTVDPSLDPTSTNPVANSAITAALADKVNVTDNNVSAYTFVNKIGDAQHEYSEHFAGPIYIRYTSSTSSSGNYYAGTMTYYISESASEPIDLYFNLSNGQITATTTSSAYFDIEIENGEAAITFKDGYYLRRYYSQNNFVALAKTIYESGQSADVIEDTVYDVFDKLNDKIDKTGDSAVTGGSMYFSNGNLESYLYTNNGRTGSSVKIDSSTIKSSNDGLSVQFANSEVADRILNVGSDSYGELFSTSSYGTSINEFTITFNPNCTQYGVYYFSVRIIDASNAMYDVEFEYDSSDMSAVYTALNTYCTVTYTILTDYKFKVTAKEGYKIARLYNSNYMVGGVDNTNPNNYISNLVTTPSYVHDGQDVIDDIYDKLDDKQDTLVSGTNIKTVNNQSLLGSGNINIQGSGNPTVELTQAEYDALVTAGTVSADTFYIITDAQAGDLTNYYTKTETNTLLGGKADTATTYTKTEVDTALASKQTTLTAGTNITIVDNVISAEGGGGGITSGEVQSMIDESVSGKQDTLISGTNIKTINNQSLLGSGNITIQGGGATYSGGSGINIDSANTISAVYRGWAGERVQYLENMTSPFYMFRADDCVDSTFQVSFYINDIQTVVEFDVSAHTYTFIEGDSSWENYVVVEWDTTFGSFKATPNTSINVSDTSCARFSQFLYSGTTENAIDGTLDIIEYIKANGFGNNIEFAARDYENDLFIAPLTLNNEYPFQRSVSFSGGIKSIDGKISTQMQATPYKWMSGVTMWSCETSDFAVPSSSVTFNISRNPNDGFYVKDVNGDSFRIIDSSGNPDSTEYYTTVIDNGYVTVTALYSDRYIKLLGDNSCELDQYVSNLQYWGYETDTIPNVVLSIKDDLSGYVETSAITSAVTSASTDAQVPSAKAVNDKLGGLSLVKLTQAQYDALETKDNSTLYVIVN